MIGTLTQKMIEAKTRAPQSTHDCYKDFRWCRGCLRRGVVLRWLLSSRFLHNNAGSKNSSKVVVSGGLVAREARERGMKGMKLIRPRDEQRWRIEVVSRRSRHLDVALVCFLSPVVKTRKMVCDCVALKNLVSVVAQTSGSKRRFQGGGDGGAWLSSASQGQKMVEVVVDSRWRPVYKVAAPERSQGQGFGVRRYVCVLVCVEGCLVEEHASHATLGPWHIWSLLLQVLSNKFHILQQDPYDIQLNLTANKRNFDGTRLKPDKPH